VLERFADPRGLYRRYVSDTLDQVLELDGAMIVSLDSTSPRRTISNGRIHLDQLEFCERALRETDANTFRIIVAHHHFAPAPDWERDQVMPQAKRALDRFAALGVDLIMGGHLHRAYVGNSLDVYPGADPDHGIVIAQCGTTTSSRGRGREKQKNTFNVLYLREDTIQVVHYMYVEREGTFAPKSRHLFPRPGRHFTEAIP